uniref:V-SNARE coiled-coil homology domain-containing protein n=1 Tax=Chlamydomonas leiostraca TaxID=1034604 RepID=A0A7S0RU98_9CHLO|mmetsp:Transcript_3044/g.7600  ORF Transcript_3044/g.7600 Transcript_3044/m.7600 type:complete len:221 (+) Transcript_3044:137-799(+)
MAAQQQKLLFALVARGTVVLAEHSVVSGNANLIAVRILEKIGSEDMRVSYTQERHMFHVLVTNGLTFMCMAEEAAGRRIPFALLDDVAARFSTAYGAAREAVAYEYSTDFAPVLAERLAYYGRDPASDPLSRVRGELSEVKHIMIENIEKVLERGEKLDLLVDKTDSLQETAFTFRSQARRLQRTLWWRNAKMWVVMGGVAAAVLYLILAASCGATLSHC